MDVSENVMHRDNLSDTMYRELKNIAQIHRRKWSGNHTLNTTSLIGEAWLKMSAGSAKYQDKTHFFATASRVMRQVLINYAERSITQKRMAPPSLNDSPVYDQNESFDIADLLYINELLEQLEKTKPRACRVLECRIFGGMTNQETATALDISVSTTKREWQLLSAWLYHEISEYNSKRNDSLQTA